MTQPQTDKLYDHHRQQLSAMLDGELSPDEARFMLRRLEHDANLAACWERWQVCGDVLRGRQQALLPADFSQRVAQAIAGQARHASTADPSAGVHAQPSRTTRWLRWGGGAALAASVAMLALIVGREAASPDAVSTEQPARVAAGAEQTPPSNPLPIRVAAGQPPVAPATGLPETLVTAATAVAVADVPRRAAERRSRGQSQRAALRSRRDGLEAVQVAANAPAVQGRPTSAIASSALTPGDTSVAASIGSGRFEDPFATRRSLSASRPWPRAILPAFQANEALTASYGDAGSADSRFHPFEPRVEVSPPDASVDRDAAGPR